LDKGIALWDMVASCQRTNSLDSSLRQIEPNDIPGLLARYPNIEAIFLVGRKSESLYRRYFGHLPLPAHYLPSPSPANRRLDFKTKLAHWSKILSYLR